MEFYEKMRPIDIIIYYLNIVNSKEEINDYLSLHQGSAKYLLGQTVRQLYLPRSKFYMSVEAKKKWNSLSTDDIWKYWYRAAVVVDTDDEVSISEYKGASKTPSNTRIVKKGDKFTFKDIFHDDHVIPINLVIKKLLKLENPTYESVKEVLGDITICRMLKSEDRRIHQRSSRPYDEKRIIHDIYLKEHGIELLDYQYDFDEYTSKSVEVVVPESLIQDFTPHPEPYGLAIAVLKNGMYTDVYKNRDGTFFTLTNDFPLIMYLRQERNVNEGVQKIPDSAFDDCPDVPVKPLDPKDRIKFD